MFPTDCAQAKTMPAIPDKDPELALLRTAALSAQTPEQRHVAEERLRQMGYDLPIPRAA